MSDGAVTVPTELPLHTGYGRDGDYRIMAEIMVAGRLRLRRDFLPSPTH